MNPRLYISGKIGDLDRNVALRHFADVAGELNQLGYDTLIPFDIEARCGDLFVRCTPDIPGNPHAWACNMRFDIIEMLKCDGVALLDNWINSPGARYEAEVAEKMGMKVRPWKWWTPAGEDEA